MEPELDQLPTSGRPCCLLPRHYHQSERRMTHQWKPRIINQGGSEWVHLQGSS